VRFRQRSRKHCTWPGT